VRPWSFWTRAKLGILADYLGQFLTASYLKVDEFVYLDAFAGEGIGLDRLSGEVFNGSARIALDAKAPDGKGFTRLRYFETESRAGELEARLRGDYPGRNIRVYGGDCNAQLPEALADLRRERVVWAPTFAFVDPDGLEVRWETLQALAEHKQGYKTKVELWLLFATPGLMRTLTLPKPVADASLLDLFDEEPGPAADSAPALRPEDEQRATALYGTDDWRAIYDRRCNGSFGPARARDEYLNLMRWRLEQTLGYEKTHPMLVKREDGVPLYHMIFATDHPAGDKIMRHLYSTAAAEMPRMAEEAKERKRAETGEADAPTLFEAMGQEAPPTEPVPAPRYVYKPPWEPPKPLAG
jgi:three-Cys-motif partner protein